MITIVKFVVVGAVRKVGDPRSWQLVAIDRPSALVVRLSGETWQRYRADYDDSKRVIAISSGARTKGSITYVRVGADDPILKGVLDNQPTEISFRRIPEPHFVLNDPAMLRWISVW